MTSCKQLKQLLIFSSVIITVASKVCYEPLGCFPTDGPWYSLPLRPFPEPKSPKEVGTRIIYFNRNSTDEGELVYENLKISVNNTDFGDDRSTFFIVHGYMGSGNTTWMHNLKDSLLNKVNDANVFLVDWGKDSNDNYFQVASNARIVGSELARFINHLITFNKMNPSNIHLIGHSLGAQVASYAAKSVGGIGRLTGLDAAQPGFEGLPKEVRIDETDADFVDLIHTNIRPIVPTLGFGMISAVGDVDIYVNGGLDQPGCYTPDGVNQISSLTDLAKVPVKVLGKWISCSHGKSHEYFTASLSAKCTHWARKAGRIRSLVNAVTLGNVEPITAAVTKCSKKTCTEIGLDTPKYEGRGIFAATTIRQYPYCDDTDELYDDGVKKEINSSASDVSITSGILNPAKKLFNF